MEYALLRRWPEYDRPMRLRFLGGETAERFTRELSDSLDGVLRYNFHYEEPDRGFVTASIEGRFFWDVLWTRDAGVFLRELVCYGYLGSAALLAERLIALCGKNAAGFHAFPTMLRPREPAAGDEVDGTAAILVGMAMLCRKLRALGDEAADAYAGRLRACVSAPDAPLGYLLFALEQAGLVAGEGEFGGGLGVHGLWYNVVQNGLVRNALRLWADVLAEEQAGVALSRRCADAADRLQETLCRVFAGPDGWYFCVGPDRKPDETVLHAQANRGFAGVNGVLAMAADADGFALPDGPLYAAGRRTFFTLLNEPQRRRWFDRYGIYIQFDQIAHGLLSSPSYGQGYALQCALLLDEPQLAGKLLDYLVTATAQPPAAYRLTRTPEHRYWFYERFLLPEYFELPPAQQEHDEGCGALNLVNVAEPLKCARLLAGFAGDGAERPLLPRLPAGFTACRIENAGVVRNGRLRFETIDVRG